VVGTRDRANKGKSWGSKAVAGEKKPGKGDSETRNAATWGRKIGDKKKFQKGEISKGGHTIRETGTGGMSDREENGPAI